MTTTPVAIARPMIRRRTVIGLTLCGALLAGCSSGDDAVVYGGAFTFVSPGGKTEFTYPESSRQTVGNFSGSSVTDPDTTINLSDYPGKIMVINVWGSWCAPCLIEVPDLEVAAELTANDGVQFLGVNVRDTRSAAADFISAQKVSYPSIFDPSMRITLSLRGLPTASIPITIILDQQHRVANIYLRTVKAQEITEAVKSLAAEPTISATPQTSDSDQQTR